MDNPLDARVLFLKAQRSVVRNVDMPPVSSRIPD